MDTLKLSRYNRLNKGCVDMKKYNFEFKSMKVGATQLQSWIYIQRKLLVIIFILQSAFHGTTIKQLVCRDKCRFYFCLYIVGLAAFYNILRNASRDELDQILKNIKTVIGLVFKKSTELIYDKSDCQVK